MFGISPFISFKKCELKLPFLSQYLPRVMAMIAGIFIAYCLSDHSLTTFNSTMFYFLMSSFIYIAFCESLSVWRSFHVTWQIMCLIISNMETALQVEYPSKVIERDFWIKFALLISINVIKFIVKIFIDANIGLSWIQDMAIIIIFFYKYIYLLHVIIYIDFIKHTLSGLRRKTAMVKSEIDCNKRIKDAQENIHLMHHIKLIHFKLWHIAQRVNKQFGWFLAAFPIDMVSTSTHSLYWIFVVLGTSNDAIYGALRKNFQCVSHLFIW